MLRDPNVGSMNVPPTCLISELASVTDNWQTNLKTLSLTKESKGAFRKDKMQIARKVNGKT